MIFLNRKWNALGQKTEEHEDKIGNALLFEFQCMKNLRKDALRIKKGSFLSSTSC